MKYISKKMFIIPIVSLLISAAVYPSLPEQIPVHFGFNGVPDNYAGKWFVFVIPLISALLTFVAEFMPKIDPKGHNYEKFPKAYQLIHWLVNLVLCGCNIFIIIYSLGYEFNVGYLAGPMVGIMFIILGNYMPKFKQSFFCGIKTPWALADEENWYKTHRFGGKLWVIGGVLFMAFPFLPHSYLPAVMIVLVLVLAFVPYLYSYLIFRNKNK